jgi:hypothetical protein
MQDISFHMTGPMKARRATIHDRAADGKLTLVPDLALPQPPEMDMGGHGLYATAGDYIKSSYTSGPNGRRVAPICRPNFPSGAAQTYGPPRGERSGPAATGGDPHSSPKNHAPIPLRQREVAG